MSDKKALKEELIKALDLRGIEYKILSDGDIDCKDHRGLMSIELLQSFKVFSYIDDMYNTGLRCIIDCK